MQKWMCVTAALVGLAPASARAQQSDAPELELRVGMVASTALAEDAVGAQAGVAPAPVVIGVLRQPVRRGVSLEVAGGWTFGSLEAESPAGGWSGGGVGVGQVVVSARREVGRAAYARAGGGALRYGGGGWELFRGDASIRPVVEVAVGGGWALGGAGVTLELLAQAHAFGTAALREAGGSDGTVYRAALLVGLSR